MAEVTGHIKLKPGKRGDVWYARYRLPDGRQRNRKLGPAWNQRSRPPAGYYTKATAQAALDGLLTDARRGTLEGSRPSAGKTFADATAEWLRYCETENELAASTLRDYRNAVAKRLLPEFGKETPLEKIDTDRIDAFRSRLLDEGKLSRRTIQKLMVLMHGVMKLAKHNKWIGSNPAEDVKRVKVKRSGDFNVLAPVEVAAVARAAETDQDKAFITIAAFTGLRLGELRALRWGDIDFAKRTILVRRNLPAGGNGLDTRPKSQKVRSVPLIDQAAQALDALSRRGHWTGEEDRVFVSPTGAAKDDGELRKAFYDALKGAGFGHLREKDDPMTVHDLRHSFGTLGASIWPLHDLQAYLGHADVQTTMIYVHHVPKESAADELSRAVAAAMNPETMTRTMTRTPEFAGNSEQVKDAVHA